ncbi:hypothetical protein I302_101629 [Kwoniella bestiolae CBS 10118]|uniref:Aldose 1-epimerase n=1 Tax=Kwoniella bestiolae CBS 10118 TaxID=1296100 RepID=A0A1B9GCS5_9TREE|nr:hypothetical protein I302_00310 [Kwoniella bestiolae CBS 10118]OCF28821.1 hypothetical protein I302_00310 [Kwoniella bestiolae CBS 10118]
MSHQPTVFGKYDNQDVLEVRLAGGEGMEASIITFGASLRSLQVSAPEGKRHVILGFPSFEDQLANKTWHFGATAGRVANRIAHGKFSLEGKEYQINLNENGRHVCHGGIKGFGLKNWSIKKQTSNSVTLGLESEDGDEGFPGNVTAEVEYTITDKSTLQMTWSATTDQTTIVNLTSHAYYNLNGSDGDNTGTHSLLFESDHYTPVDDGLIPTGELASVEGTPFDFRQSRAIELPDSFHYDHNLVLRDHTGRLRRAVEVVSSKRDLKMEIWTDQPAIQFFDGKPLNLAQPGHDNMRIGSRSGIALEPQVHPDAINQPSFPNTVLKRGEVYKHHSELRFSVL